MRSSKSLAALCSQVIQTLFSKILDLPLQSNLFQLTNFLNIVLWYIFDWFNQGTLYTYIPVEKNNILFNVASHET